jgi:hypothetical protein
MTTLKCPDGRMINECEAFGGMIIGKGNQCAQGKPAKLPLYMPKIPHNLTWV